MAKTTKTTTPTIDIVYPLAFLYNYREFRYSLRSLKNLPHGKVWVAGYAPDWLENANFTMVEKPIEMNRKNHEIGNIYAVVANIKATAEDSELSDNFILMNDDFFICQPLDSLPNLHRGPLDDVIAEYKAQGSKEYVATMERTKEFLEGLGYKDLLSYELHTPMLFNKQKWLSMYEIYKDYEELHPMHTRTIYGNMFSVGGEPIKDVKIYDYETRLDPDWTFCSTNDQVFIQGKVGQDLRELFNEPSKYEGDNDATDTY